MKVIEDVLPWLSVAVQVTVVFPAGNMVPDSGVHVATPAPSTISFVVGEVYVTGSPSSLVVCTRTFAIGEIVGGVVSCTVTVKLPLVELPASSVAVQLTDVGTSSTKRVPEGGTHTGVIDVSRLSETTAEKLTIAPAALVASGVMLPGTFNVGAVISMLMLD